jgi:hypothetical protein
MHQVIPFMVRSVFHPYTLVWATDTFPLILQICKLKLRFTNCHASRKEVTPGLNTGPLAGGVAQVVGSMPSMWLSSNTSTIQKQPPHTHTWASWHCFLYHPISCCPSSHPRSTGAWILWPFTNPKGNRNFLIFLPGGPDKTIRLKDHRSETTAKYWVQVVGGGHPRRDQRPTRVWSIC